MFTRNLFSHRTEPNFILSRPEWISWLEGVFFIKKMPLYFTFSSCVKTNRTNIRYESSVHNLKRDEMSRTKTYSVRLQTAQNRWEWYTAWKFTHSRTHPMAKTSMRFMAVDRNDRHSMIWARSVLFWNNNLFSPVACTWRFHLVL